MDNLKVVNCKVCNHPLDLQKDKGYLVKENNGLASYFKPGDIWHATDCPYCGCQNLLTKRFVDYVPGITIDVTELDEEEREQETEAQKVYVEEINGTNEINEADDGKDVAAEEVE